MSQRFPQGTTRGAVARIGAALGVLLVVFVVLGAIQASGITVSWGVFGPLAGAVLIYCVIAWKDRRTSDLAPGTLAEIDDMLDLIEQERVTDQDQRTSLAANPSLFFVRDLAQHARNDLSYGFEERAAQTMVRIAEVIGRDDWAPDSALYQQGALIGRIGEDHLGPSRD